MQNFYKKHISKAIEATPIANLDGTHIDYLVDSILAKANKSYSYNATSAKALGVMKKICNRAVKYGQLSHSVLELFSPREVGYKDIPKSRAFTKPEIKQLIQALQNQPECERVNVIAVCLLLVLGKRKIELIKSVWKDICFNEREWLVEKTKTGADIVIPFSPLVKGWLEELKELSMGESHLFPKRQETAKAKHISESTLNGFLERALSELKIEVHDLRRTTRTTLRALDIPVDVAESYINHKQKAYRYNFYHRLPERKRACKKLSKLIKKYLTNKDG
ncbi:tyrosine-type recombinase/integrase [Pseudoalteromonas rubra]|uniref:Tyrosine-type recombinase/integrase n=1 Tax=Pseudoalteromonas rubra TaxID=43658 RepID=A0A5S3UVX3_9GAMM|nr:tyrosine-type recombinase/integrase [Pseudoalteromonas rubra]QPB84563.1 tyrosine-type recombinase/integrase [Pseudoalteromonas rubra]